MGFREVVRAWPSSTVLTQNPQSHQVRGIRQKIPAGMNLCIYFTHTIPILSEPPDLLCSGIHLSLQKAEFACISFEHFSLSFHQMPLLQGSCLFLDNNPTWKFSLARTQLRLSFPAYTELNELAFV